MNTNVLSESYTVLIVDESAENRATVKRYLNQDPDHTYRFEETELGKAGLELCVSRQPNLILLNCSLPDITGLEFLKALTARMTEGHCPVIVLADETSAAGCMKYGAQDYLVKDKLTPESLRHVVQVSLQTYQLKLQERHFLATSILESISEAFCALDAEERFTYVNHRAEEFWNISRKELLGKKFGEIFPRMAGIAEYQYLRQAITEQTPLNFESYISAIQRWIKIKVYPANDGVSVYFEDITAQKQAEEQLRRWNEELEKRVEERTAALTAEIEEHKRTEEALRESEERFRLVAENSTDVIWTMNMEGQFTYVSPSVLQLRGYTPEEVLKQSMAEALTPKSVIIAREGLLGILQVTQEGNPGRRLDQMEQPCKDGSTVWTEVSTCLMYASNGEFKGILGISRDISERKRAEEALRESEEKFAAIFQSSPVATLISNLADGLILDANSQAQEFFGYRHDLLVGHTSLELNIWLDPTLRDQLQQKLIQQGSIRNFETSFRRSNGEIRHALASYELLELGGKTLVLSLLHDITEIAKANRAQAMLAAIVESSEDAILSVNLAGCLQSWNAGATKLFGYTASEIMGQHFSLLVTSEQLEEQSRIVAKILGGEVVGHFDTFRRHKNGTKIAVSMAVSPMKTSSGEIIGVCTTIRDITARKEAEEALRQSEMRNRLFAEAIRNADDAIVITDAVLDSPGPQIIFANPAFTTMTGYTLEEAYGKTPRILQGAKSDRAVLDCLRRNLAAGENFQGEIINYRKDGSELYQEFRISPVKDEQGKTTNFIAIKRDITARKQAEAALRESEERYRFLAENSTDTISRLSYAGVFEYVSPASQKIIGFAPEELVGHTFLEFVHPDDHEQFLKLLSNWQGQN
ncbi:MAG: PAS domain S-box protein, partial [Chloroflexi bacterium]|nr:PAS domain S-box protein [Chloroflexota bacterium]